MHVPTKESWPHAAFIAWLDELKKSLGVSSDNQLAGRVGIASASVVSNWRRGATQPDVGNLRKLADAAGVPAISVYALAGRVADDDMGEQSMEAVHPLPRALRELNELYRTSDEPTRAVLLQQVEFLLKAVGPTVPEPRRR